MKSLKQKNHLKKPLMKRFQILILLNPLKIFSQVIQVHQVQVHQVQVHQVQVHQVQVHQLSLSTKQQPNDNILLQYSDSSGKTKSVSVVIRTEQKEIFSGTFFTSMFETTVNDASGIPYFVDMVVEHEDYGTVTSSVFNTGDASDSNINGIFYQ